MLQIFTLATLMFADTTPLTLSEQLFEKIEEEIDFAQPEVTLAVENESDHVEGAFTEVEVGELFEKMEPEMDHSFEGEIAHESAKILSEEMEMEEVQEELKPTYEDLSGLVTTPPITMAEEDLAESQFDKLTISIDEKVKVGKILMTMAENSVIKLLFERKRLESWGHDIRHVHPLRFLGTVFTNPRLVHCMRRIRTSSFKWDGFIDGFSERFKDEIDSNNVLPYLPGFAETVGVEVAPLEKYVEKNDFEGLVLYLMKAKSQ